MIYVFVYGTLRPGQKYHNLIERFVVESKPAFVAGRLYHLPQGYPALVLDRDFTQNSKIGKVAGDLLGFTKLEPVLPILDELEDYYGPNDPRNLYERVTIPAITKKGIPVVSTAYVFSRDKLDWLEQYAIPIREGNWVKWNAKRSPLL